jgi:tetratricopeptide (TPR) repeat protein
LYVGWTVLQKGEVQEGLRIMDEALDLNPIRPTYYYRHYAEALWAAKRYEASLEQSEECLRKAPEYTYCHIFRMLALVGLGRKDAAATAYRNGLLHSPNLDKAITLVIPPHPELAGRFREDLATLGWKRPS